ncbi:MAG: pyridoxamine 5'-phosphate oxidase [Verrucomicrobia bacterium]|nr:pyridoxamine 5'-phosphate oxidase [Verrucomicrobiota bacterium]
MNTTSDIADLRKEYTLLGLRREQLSPDPFVQFRSWFEESVRVAGSDEPNAMTLATAGKDGRPSARVVLLKGYGPNGFVFFTNYESRKAQQLAGNPFAALSFYWPWLERQIQIEGTVDRVTREESEKYFNRRPKGSRLGAIASRQSEVIPSRELLERRLAELAATYVESEPPTPETWGGYRLAPDRFEFWQGRENRLHDRFCYVRTSENVWRIDRLSP